jgi:methylmalonyl-CoA/ethylmalonyl-CoA epimerase
VILGLDHVGLATADPAGVGGFLAQLGMARADAGTADGYGVACEFWRHPGGQTAIEVVSPTRPDSSVSDMLTRDGPGLYHVAFAVDDLDAERGRLREQGFLVVDATPCQGARAGMRVVFMYLRKPAGLLIELVEYAAGSPQEGDRLVSRSTPAD